MSAADGPALVAAAVRAAILAKAPRRTVQCVAIGVAGVVFGRPATASATTAAPSVLAGSTRAAADLRAAEPSPDELVAALRSARSTHRRLKKARRRAAQATATAAEELRQEQAHKEKNDDASDDGTKKKGNEKNKREQKEEDNKNQHQNQN